MKTAVSMLFGVLVLVFRMDFAGAAVITVNVTGHVVGFSSSPSDPFANNIYVGEPITASYTYDTATGPYLQDTYRPNMPPASSAVNIGPFTFGSVLPPAGSFPGSNPAMEVAVFPGMSANGASFSIAVPNNQLLQGGTPAANPNQLIYGVSFNFYDATGQWPADMNLPSGAPALASLANSSIYIIMNSATVSENINIQIDSVALVPTTFEVSPASGNFVAQQRFDAALLVPAGMAQITTAQASVNGNPISALSYPAGTCTLAPTTTSSAILCPNASDFIDPAAVLPGPTIVDWQVTLTDGTVMHQTVSWNRVH